MNVFFELIQVAIGVRDRLSVLPKDRPEWDDLSKVAAEHNLLAFTFPVIDRLHDEEVVPLGVYTRWAMATEKTKEKHASHLEACRHLSERFGANGFRSCILKGQAAAALYPNPEYRQCGDIDIWLEGERQAVVDFLRARFPVRKVDYHQCDVSLVRGISTEVHFIPSWMNGYAANQRAQKYFREHADEQFGNYNTELGFAVPTLRFDAVFMLMHIYRHVMEEGIGLRQLLDYYYVLKALPADERPVVIDDLRSLGLSKFLAAVMYVLKEVFGAGEGLLLCTPDRRQGAFLLDEIMASGNFGRFDARNAHEKGESIGAHFKRKLSRSLRFLMYFPGEVLSMPFFMLWQYLWRRRHNYLYKGR